MKDGTGKARDRVTGAEAARRLHADSECEAEKPATGEDKLDFLRDLAKRCKAWFVRFNSKLTKGDAAAHEAMRSAQQSTLVAAVIQQNSASDCHHLRARGIVSIKEGQAHGTCDMCDSHHRVQEMWSCMQCTDLLFCDQCHEMHHERTEAAVIRLQQWCQLTRVGCKSFKWFQMAVPDGAEPGAAVSVTVPGHGAVTVNVPDGHAAGALVKFPVAVKPMWLRRLKAMLLLQSSMRRWLVCRQKAPTETTSRSVLPEVTVPSTSLPELAVRTMLPKTGTKRPCAEHQPQPAKRQKNTTAERVVTRSGRVVESKESRRERESAAREAARLLYGRRK